MIKYVLIGLMLLVVACKQEEPQKRETVSERMERQSKEYCRDGYTYYHAVISGFKVCVKNEEFPIMVRETLRNGTYKIKDYYDIEE